MTQERRYKRAVARSNKKHVPFLTKLLVETVGCLSMMGETKLGLEQAQSDVEHYYLQWIRYCAQQKHFKGLPPEINSFVDNLVKMI